MRRKWTFLRSSLETSVQKIGSLGPDAWLASHSGLLLGTVCSWHQDSPFTVAQSFFLKATSIVTMPGHLEPETVSSGAAVGQYLPRTDRYEAAFASLAPLPLALATTYMWHISRPSYLWTSLWLFELLLAERGIWSGLPETWLNSLDYRSVR